ncbi:MAG: hypothetical protein KBT03_09230 [Bacteroidales bacterium]|nr:hypothetical protein [Candidatus Scybalousia scybalohippi]
MRLIDADELKEKYTQIFVEKYGIKCAEMFHGVINQTPIAYNVDAVVEELEALGNRYFAEYCECGEFDLMKKNSRYARSMAYDEAIEIVKRGGKNDD